MLALKESLNPSMRNRVLSVGAALALGAGGAIGILCAQAMLPSDTGAIQLAHANWKSTYKGVLKKIDQIEYISGYRYLDVVGSKTKELLVCSNTGRESVEIFRFYTYKKGKAKRLWKKTFYGLSKLWFYKKTKSFGLSKDGHGGESCQYYKLKGGKYKPVVSKWRSMDPDTGNYRAWFYTKGSGSKRISRGNYNKQIKKLKRGKVRGTRPYLWHWY